MDVYCLALILLLFGTSSIYCDDKCRNSAKCSIRRVHKMKAADCYKRDFRSFPQCLSSDVEIIELSENRIRKLEKNDLQRYSSLKMLYLSDNLIVSIDNDVFDGKNNLNTLHLSINAISKLPPVVFQLPSLKSLYLSQNLNINMVDVVEKAKPVTSPLEHLDLSFINDEFNQFPQFDIMPFLVKFNISGNLITSLSTKHFAGLCKLQYLVSANVTAEFDSPCECWTINKWLHSRNVKFQPFTCNIHEEECEDIAVSAEDLQLYEDCLEQVKIEEKSRILKIIIPCVITVVLLLIAAGGWFYYLRRKKLKLQRKSDKNQLALIHNNVNSY